MNHEGTAKNNILRILEDPDLFQVYVILVGHQELAAHESSSGNFAEGAEKYRQLALQKYSEEFRDQLTTHEIMQMLKRLQRILGTSDLDLKALATQVSQIKRAVHNFDVAGIDWEDVSVESAFFYLSGLTLHEIYNALGSLISPIIGYIDPDFPELLERMPINLQELRSRVSSAIKLVEIVEAVQLDQWQKFSFEDLTDTLPDATRVKLHGLDFQMTFEQFLSLRTLIHNALKFTTESVDILISRVDKVGGDKGPFISFTIRDQGDHWMHDLQSELTDLHKLGEENPTFPGLSSSGGTRIVSFRAGQLGDPPPTLYEDPKGKSKSITLYFREQPE